MKLKTALKMMYSSQPVRCLFYQKHKFVACTNTEYYETCYDCLNRLPEEYLNKRVIQFTTSPDFNDCIFISCSLD